jgi:hypothetical protein
MTGPEIAAAFMQQNDKKTWKARNVNRARSTGPGDVVHFEATGGMVSLMYYVDTGRFAVKFNKFHGAWGDYIKAIARSLFTVLNTLKSAGLPFDAPPSLAGMIIEATTTDDTTTFVRWPGITTPGNVIERMETSINALAREAVENQEPVAGLPPVL